MIDRVELTDGYSVIVENDHESEESQMGIEKWTLMFASKQAVIEHIALLNKALEFWDYD